MTAWALSDAVRGLRLNEQTDSVCQPCRRDRLEAYPTLPAAARISFHSLASFDIRPPAIHLMLR